MKKMCAYCNYATEIISKENNPDKAEFMGAYTPYYVSGILCKLTQLEVPATFHCEKFQRAAN